MSKLIADPLETLIVRDHQGDELLLELSLESWNILVEALVATTGLDHGVSSSQLAIVPVGSDQVKVVSDVHDWNSDMLVVYVHSDVLIQIMVLSWVEVNRRLSKELIHLLLNNEFVNLALLELLDVVKVFALLPLNFLHLLEDLGLLSGSIILG